MVTSSAIRLVHLKLSSEKISVHFIAACGYAARGLMPDKTEQKQDAEQREFIDRKTTTNKTYTTNKTGTNKTGNRCGDSTEKCPILSLIILNKYVAFSKTIFHGLFIQISNFD